MCQEIDKFKNIFHEELYIVYSMLYTVFEVKYFKTDFFFFLHIKIY